MSTAAARSPKPCCHLRLELANELSTAARLYSESVVLLATLAPQHPDLDLWHEEAVAAQQRAESAHVAFECHIRAHGC